MKRTWLRVLLLPLILATAWLVIGHIIVWYGTSLSPDDGIPWPGMLPIWLQVGQQTPRGGSEDIVGARVYVNGHYVGVTRGGGPSLSVNLWRMRTYEIEVTKTGYTPSVSTVRAGSLGEVGPGPYRGLDVTLRKKH